MIVKRNTRNKLLKQKDETDVSSEQAAMRNKLRALQRQMDLMIGNISENSTDGDDGILLPQEIIDEE